MSTRETPETPGAPEASEEETSVRTIITYELLSGVQIREELYEDGFIVERGVLLGGEYWPLVRMRSEGDMIYMEIFSKQRRVPIATPGSWAQYRDRTEGYLAAWRYVTDDSNWETHTEWYFRG